MPIHERQRFLVQSPALSNLVFLIMPLLYFGISLKYIYYAGSYYSTDVDPEFNYLFNGITLAQFKMHLNAVGHPGTPLQCLIAVMARIVHLFRPGQPLWDDVMQHPWIYMRATVYAAAVINSFMLFMLGRKVGKYSGSIVPAVFLQFTPFAYLITIEASYRLMPELIMPAIVCCWIILLVRLLYDQNPHYGKYSIMFAVLVGFSLAAKLTFLPFFILPLFLLPGMRLKIKYSAFSILSFLAFAFPVLFNFNKFTGWVFGIIGHKGVYGGGEKGFIDVRLFVENLRVMVNNTRLLEFTFCFLIVSIILSIIIRKKQDTAFRLSVGLIALFLFHYFINAKHFALYYLTPSLLLCVFTGFMAFFLLMDTSMFLKKSSWPQVFMLSTGIILMFVQIPRVFNGLEALGNRKLIKEEAQRLFQPYFQKRPRIIVPDYYGCSSVEYALLFGIQESGRYAKELTEKFVELYPETIIFLPWNGYFYVGRDVVYPRDFLVPQQNYTVFIAGDSEKVIQQFTDSLAFDSTATLSLRLENKFAPTHEEVFSLILK